MSESKIKNIESIYENAHKRLFFRKRTFCPLSEPNAPQIDYKDIKLLSKYISERGRILPSRISSISAKKQKELRLAIKRARLLALLPFVKQ
jgi:small subunit ribosomal protein S18